MAMSMMDVKKGNIAFLVKRHDGGIKAIPGRHYVNVNEKTAPGKGRFIHEMTNTIAALIKASGEKYNLVECDANGVLFSVNSAREVMQSTLNRDKEKDIKEKAYSDIMAKMHEAGVFDEKTKRVFEEMRNPDVEVKRRQISVLAGELGIPVPDLDQILNSISLCLATGKSFEFPDAPSVRKSKNYKLVAVDGKWKCLSPTNEMVRLNLADKDEIEKRVGEVEGLTLSKIIFSVLKHDHDVRAQYTNPAICDDNRLVLGEGSYYLAFSGG